MVRSRLRGESGFHVPRLRTCMRRVLIRRMSSLPSSSGDVICGAGVSRAGEARAPRAGRTSISLEKRPKRRSAPSMVLGLLVAAMTITLVDAVRPSMSVSSCETMRFSTSPLALSRFGAMVSTSSIQMMAGEFLIASSKQRRRWPSDSPALPLMTSGPLMRKKKAPVSEARACPMIVLPQPAGPKSRTPLGGLTPTR